MSIFNRSGGEEEQSVETAPNVEQAPSQSADKGQSQDSKLTQGEQDMVHRLKEAIDQNGRYGYRLNDMAAGYAAAKDMPRLAAKEAIEKKFEQQLGSKPKQYLDQHYEMRRNMGQGRGR